MEENHRRMYQPPYYLPCDGRWLLRRHAREPYDRGCLDEKDTPAEVSEDPAELEIDSTVVSSRAEKSSRLMTLPSSKTAGPSTGLFGFTLRCVR